MKNLDLREKYKKALSLLTAFMLMHAPATALVEKSEDSYTNETKYAQMLEETEVAPMTAEEFAQNVEKAREALAPLTTGDALVYDAETHKFVPYSTLYEDIPNIYYAVNAAYIEGKEEIIEAGVSADNSYHIAWVLSNAITLNNQQNSYKINSIVDLTEINCEDYDAKVLIKYLKKVGKKYTVFKAVSDYNKEIKKKDPNKVVNLGEISRYNEKILTACLGRVAKGECDLSTAMNDYNEQVTNDVNSSLIDVGALCYNPAERKFVHSMFENYKNAYKNGKFGNQYYEELIEQISYLKNNVTDGVRWLVMFTIGNDLDGMNNSYLREKYYREEGEPNELDEYYESSGLDDGMALVVREDIELSENSENEIERIAFYTLYKQSMSREVAADLMEELKVGKINGK